MSQSRVQLLVSVRDVREAQAAIAGGADVIDIKEPDRGPLGMADVDRISEIAAVVAGRRPVSVAMGDLGQAPPMTWPDGVGYVKVGLAGAPEDWPQRLAGQFERWRPRQPIVAIYADHHRVEAPSPTKLLTWAYRYRPVGVLFDTAVKDGRHLLDWLDPKDLQLWIGQLRQQGLSSALAGSLAGPQLVQAATLGPDIIAVRGAACCQGNRRQPIDPGRIHALKHQLQQHGDITNELTVTS